MSQKKGAAPKKTNHRIRITLTSRNPKALEKGMLRGRDAPFFSVRELAELAPGAEGS